jgi:hypothetical protein
MPRPEDRSLNFKDFSEIDYFFSSNLANTAWGIDRLIQRIILFDPLRRHIPYLALMYMTFYNNEFDPLQKKEILKKLINGLNKNVIKKAARNPLNDFIPPYFVMSLLMDLYMAGYNVKPLIRKLKVDQIENPVISIKKYGDYAIKGFPEALVFFFEQLVFFPDIRNKLIFEILNKSDYSDFLCDMAESTLLANNFSGYNHIFKKIKDKKSRYYAQKMAASIHAERKEIARAIRIAESAKTLREKFLIYLDISFTLLMDDQVEIVHEMELNITSPEIRFAMVASTISYYILKQVKEKAMRKLEEAYDLNKLIKDIYFDTINSTFLFVFEYKLGRNKEAIRNMENVIFNINNILTPPDLETAFNNLLHRLAVNHQFEKVKELIENKFSDPGQFDEWTRNHNICKKYQMIIGRILRNIDWRIREQKHRMKAPEPLVLPEDYHAAKIVVEMIPASGYKDEYLVKIALHHARNGFYQEARELIPHIKDESFRQQFDMECPIYAVINEDLAESINMANSISNNKLRTEILLAMTPHLAKQNHYKESLEFVHEWAITSFHNV